MKPALLTPEQSKELMEFYKFPKPLTRPEIRMILAGKTPNQYSCQPLRIGRKSDLRQSLLKTIYDQGQIKEIVKLCSKAKLQFREINHYPGFKLIPAKGA